MPKIIDKEKKRETIALSAKKLILQKGIHTITVAEVAKTANIGKGTIYEYFKNKNEIVFVLITILMKEHFEILQKKITDATTTKEKIRVFSGFFYDDAQKELRQIYKQFIALSLADPDDEMMQFHKQSLDAYYEWFKQIIETGVRNGELVSHSQRLIQGIFATGEGLFIQYCVTNMEERLKNDLDDFIDNIFYLLEKKS